MKFHCKKEQLKDTFTLVERVTGKNVSLPILKMVLLQVKDKTLTLRATNLEVGVEATISVKVEKEGTVAVPAHVVSTFLSSCSDSENITIEMAGNNLTLSTSKNSALVKTHPHDDFPTLPKKSLPNRMKIKGRVFTSGVRAVLFAAATSDIKPEIASVLIYSDKQSLVFVATDSFRLAEKKIKGVNVSVEGILIPYRNAIEVVRFFEDVDDEVTVSFDKNQLSIEGNNLYLTTRLTDGVYPDYKQIVPTQYETKATLLTKDIMNSLKATNIFVDEFNKITIKVLPEDKIVEIDSKNPHVGEGTAQTEAHIEGTAIEAGFNHKYLSDVFGILSTDSVSFNFSGQNKPLVVSPIGDPSFIYLVMPVGR